MIQEITLNEKPAIGVYFGYHTLKIEHSIADDGTIFTTLSAKNATSISLIFSSEILLTEFIDELYKSKFLNAGFDYDQAKIKQQLIQENEALKAEIEKLKNDGNSH